MIVVSNTSPLTNLAAIGQFDLLRRLFGSLTIPEAVLDELRAGGKQWPGSEEVASSDWIHLHAVRNQHLVTELRSSLGAGESEAIALALETHADLVLMDERDGRR